MGGEAVSVAQGHRVSGVAVDHANREKDDFYPTPPKATQALLSVGKFDGAIWEPACGDGAISIELIAAGYDVISSDLVDRDYAESRIDFLMEWQARAPNIVTNPPFKMVAPFIRHSLAMTTGKVAMLLRLQCLEGAERRKIYDSTPLARVHVFSNRLTMYRAGKPTGEGGMLAFAWSVWEHGYAGKPTLGWL